MDRLRLAMVGGGRGAFIGAVHRAAAALDGEFVLTAGAFSSTPEKSKTSGADLGLPDDRVYGDYREMFDAESALPPGERSECVAIVTPNHTHFEIASAALAAGFHVICDKPLTHRLEDAVALQRLVKQSGLTFALTHNYTGYPLVKEARALVRDGRLGNLRKVIVEYSQGWLAEPLERDDDIWRTDPDRSGICGCMGDIGTHAMNLLEYMTGRRITEVCAELNSFVEGRRLDDDGNVLLRMEGGAGGVLHASQVCIGEENNLNIRIYGDLGGLAWEQQSPNRLMLGTLSGNDEIVRAGAGNRLSAPALSASRLPGGHPEGFIEAFANIYRAFAATVRSDAEADFPTVGDGVRGMAFLQALVDNTNGDARWTPVANYVEDSV